MAHSQSTRKMTMAADEAEAMKMLKAGALIAELPDNPKNFEGHRRGGKISVVVGNDEVVLG